MPDLTWRRIDALGGGLQAYYRGKWRLRVHNDPAVGWWHWYLLRVSHTGSYHMHADGRTKRQRDAKHMAACALEMMEGER